MKMFSKLQKASDKARSYLQDKPVTINGARTSFSSSSCVFGFGGRHSSMAAKKTAKIQSIYDLCKKTFTPSAAPPPSSQPLRDLASLLDNVGPKDVGLDEEILEEDQGHGFFGLEQLNRIARWAQPITYVDVYEGQSFTMCLFCFPTSSVIPLHDHPRMTVFSKVLFGSLHVKAYDWVEPACIRESKGPAYFPVRLAKLAVDKVVTASCGTSVLYPKTGGNLHCFTAITPCAVLDILSPPYREDEGRRCTYYHDYPYSTFCEENGGEPSNGKVEYAWLKEIETPDDLYMRTGRYTGPSIQV